LKIDYTNKYYHENEKKKEEKEKKKLGKILNNPLKKKRL